MKNSLTDGQTDRQTDNRTDDGHIVMGKALADIVSWAKKKNAKKKKLWHKKKTKLHNFKNKDAYFQERKNEDAKIKRKTKMQILGEPCKPSSRRYLEVLVLSYTIRINCKI